jgi:radical SAM/Cys-rich protein
MSIRQAGKSLLSRQNPLSDSLLQLEVLNGRPGHSSGTPSFASTLDQAGRSPLRPDRLEILQINVGKLCNQSCTHCHVDAGPDRTEVMTKETMESCLDVIRNHFIPTIDITGGAPELNPHFRWFVEQCRALGAHVMDRCNLTILVSNPKYADLPLFFASHGVELMCSLPHYNALRTDHQRGSGVFADSIKALTRLHEAGYGIPGSGLILNLIHNPSGAFLPGDQQALESDFRSQLKRKYGIEFNHLFSITNLPISRFLDDLIETGNYAMYMELLLNAFNPATIDHLMCRNTLSVSWDGYLYDCDFNQMLGLKVASPVSHISLFDPSALQDRDIVTNQHCYGCTAGAGSSCGGNLV